jgi:hypothetical protein
MKRLFLFQIGVFLFSLGNVAIAQSSHDPPN